MEGINVFARPMNGETKFDGEWAESGDEWAHTSEAEGAKTIS